MFHNNSLLAQNLADTVQKTRALLIEHKNEAAYKLLVNNKEAFLSYDNDTVLAVYYTLAGRCCCGLQNFSTGISILKDACLIWEYVKLKREDYFDCLYNIAVAYERSGDFKNAESYYRKAILRSVTGSLNDNTDEYRALIYTNLGHLYKEQGDVALAEECFKKASQPGGFDKTDVEKAGYTEWENGLWYKANKYREEGKFQESIEVLSELTSGIEKNMGKNDNYVLALYGKAITLRGYLQKFDEAIPLFEEIISLKDSISPYNENVCGSYCNLALCLAFKWEYTKVDELLPEAYEYLLKATNDIFPINSLYRFIGNGAFWANDYSHAITYYEMYLNPKYEREKGKSYEEITNQLAVSYIFSGEPEKANKLLSDFLSTDEKRILQEIPDVLANIYHNLGRSFMLMNSFPEALTYLEKSKKLQKEVFGGVSDKTELYIEECNQKKR